jgi:hypothetical protein
VRVIKLVSRRQRLRLLAVPLAALATAGLAACGSHHPAAGSPASGSTAPAAGGSISPAASSPAAPAGLSVVADISLGAAPATGQPVFAEAPDGTVFYAAGPVVMVVDHDDAPAVAEHAGAAVLGLGASTSTLYVVTAKGLIAYSRSSGNQTGHWALPGSPGTPTTAGITPGDDGTVWVWTDWATDQSGYEYATVYVVPAGAHTATTLSQTAEPGTLVTDGLNGYFLVSSQNSQAASLVEWQDATGQDVTGDPAPAQALAAFSQGHVLLYQSGSGLHEYTPGASAGAGPRISGFARTSVTAPDGFAATSSGLLFLTCTAAHCATVTQVSQTTGTAGQSVAIPGSDHATWLMPGPSPAVFTSASGQMHLLRLT